MALDAAAVDSKVAEVGEELLGAVLALHELVQILGIIDELFDIQIRMPVC